MVEKNKMMVSDYSEGFSEKYHQQLNGMVERRMLAAIHIVGCYWYTAWKDAGQPKLSNWKSISNDLSTEVSADSIKAGFQVREEE
ncbi:hypothetical protein D3C78_1693780 [compost metagenome]